MIEPTQPGKPYHYSNINDIPLPPPPPPAEYYMQQKTGKLWKFSIPILMLLFFGIIAVLAYPVVMSVVKPSKDVTPTPYVPFSLGATTSQSTAASDTSYRNDMNSLNYYRLIPAWSKALSHRDWNTISYHTDKQDFVILCVADYPCNGSDWPTTKGALEGGYLQLSIPEPYKLVTNICPDLTNWGPRMISDAEPLYVKGTFKNDYQESGISSATQSGPATFQFQEVWAYKTVAGTILPTQTPLNTMLLEAVYLNARC